jgi:hypothetical protein
MSGQSYWHEEGEEGAIPLAEPSTGDATPPRGGPSAGHRRAIAMRLPRPRPLRGRRVAICAVAASALAVIALVVTGGGGNSPSHPPRHLQSQRSGRLDRLPQPAHRRSPDTRQGHPGKAHTGTRHEPSAAPDARGHKQASPAPSRPSPPPPPAPTPVATVAPASASPPAPAPPTTTTYAPSPEPPTTTAPPADGGSSNDAGPGGCPPPVGYEC